MIPLIVIFGLGAAIPIIASFIICVPKWWGEVIKSRIPKLSISIPSPNFNSWYMLLFRLILVLLIWPLFLVAGILIKYWHSVASLVERKCPYTLPEVESDFNSHQQQAERFEIGLSKMFVGSWDFILGRE